MLANTGWWKGELPAAPERRAEAKTWPCLSGEGAGWVAGIVCPPFLLPCEGGMGWGSKQGCCKEVHAHPLPDPEPGPGLWQR